MKLIYILNNFKLIIYLFNDYINKLKNMLENLKSHYILEIILNYITKKKSLEIIKCNKKIQQRLNINIKDYKNYSEMYSSIEIDIIPIFK